MMVKLGYIIFGMIKHFFIEELFTMHFFGVKPQLACQQKGKSLFSKEISGTSAVCPIPVNVLMDQMNKISMALSDLISFLFFYD